jgi:hypothetical protein
MSENSPLNSDHDAINAKYETIRINDSLFYTPEPEYEDQTVFDVTIHDSLRMFPTPDTTNENPDHPSGSVSSNEPTHSDSPVEKTEPVVIKKQIIQHQTVVVRDTILIIE